MHLRIGIRATGIISQESGGPSLLRPTQGRGSNLVLAVLTLRLLGGEVAGASLRFREGPQPYFLLNITVVRSMSGTCSLCLLNAVSAHRLICASATSERFPDMPFLYALRASRYYARGSGHVAAN